MRQPCSLVWLWAAWACGPLAAPLEASPTIWNPQPAGGAMGEHVYNCDGTSRIIKWIDHGGFAMSVDDKAVYDNWRTVDNAPRVQLRLTGDLNHLRACDFVLQVKITLDPSHGDAFHAGLYVAFGANDLLVFGPHGSTDLRVRRPDSPYWWVPSTELEVYLKLIRHRDEYTAWHSYDGEIWQCDGVLSIINLVPTDVGTILKTWGQPHAEQVAFQYFEITHLEDEPAQYHVNTPYTGVTNSSIHFKYDLSGIDIPLHVFIRDADGIASNNYDRKLYYIHGSLDPPPPPYNGEKFINFIQEMTNAINKSAPIGRTDVVLVAPAFFGLPHPYWGTNMQYRDLAGEEDWRLIDIHENFIRQRFPASTDVLDRRFYLTGSSAGGQYVNRFLMVHPHKLHAAITRAAGRVTLPTVDLEWSRGIRLDSEIRWLNPRLQIDLPGVAGLRVAALCGENDNELFLAANQPVDQPFVCSRLDGMKKWLRQIHLACGPDTEGRVIIQPREGHGYGSFSRDITFDYFFGTPADSEHLSHLVDRTYSYALSDQDQFVPVPGKEIPDDALYYARFHEWDVPSGEFLYGHDLLSNTGCLTRNTCGMPIGALHWKALRASNGQLGLMVANQMYKNPRLHYGRLLFESTDGERWLEQSAFVTQAFLQDWVLGQVFYLYLGTGRVSAGPKANRAPEGPFYLRADGPTNGTVWAAPGVPYARADMKKWFFDPDWSRLFFTYSNGSYTNDTPCIGEWRWGFHRNGSRFVAGLHTRDNHDVDHMEIQTDASFGARYFEEWDLGVHTWMGGDIDGDGLPDRWERAHSSGYTNLQPHADNDGDGIDNLSEFRAGTNPVDRHSLLRFVDATWTGMGLRLSWQSVSGHSYALSRSPDVFDPQSYVDICNRILGDPDLTVITDAQMSWPGPWFYRVRDEGLPPPLSVATQGLLAYYDFQGGALDRSGNARHATLLGGAHCAAGSMGNCLFLDGQDDCVQTPLNINPALLPELTMSVWVKPLAYNGRRQILSHDDGDFDRSLLIQDGYWTVFTGGQRWTLDRKVVIDQWQHLVLVMAASDTYLYVDGNWEFGPAPGNGASANLLRLGDNPGPYEEHFFGYMDEVRIYNRALSVAEVWELYANPQLDLPGE